MGKFLRTNELADLQAKADNYDAIVQSILSVNNELKSDDVTLDMIQSTLSGNAMEITEVASNSTDRINELESQIKDLISERDNLKSENNQLNLDIQGLKSENEELSQLPGSASVSSVAPVAEPLAEATDDVLSFANANKGNTSAILAKMKESGMI